MQIAVPNDVQQAAYITYQSYHLQAAQKEPHKKRLTLEEKCLRIFSPKKQTKKGRRMDHKQKNDKTERARGPGREDIGKGNQMTALRFQMCVENMPLYIFVFALLILYMCALISLVILYMCALIRV